MLGAVTYGPLFELDAAALAAALAALAPAGLATPGVEGAASDGSPEPEGGADRRGASGQPEVGVMDAAALADVRRFYEGRPQLRACVLGGRDRWYLPITTDRPLAIRYALTIGGAGCVPETVAAAHRALDAADLAEGLGGAGTPLRRSTPGRRSAGLHWYHLLCLL